MVPPARHHAIWTNGIPLETPPPERDILQTCTCPARERPSEGFRFPPCVWRLTRGGIIFLTFSFLIQSVKQWGVFGKNVGCQGVCRCRVVILRKASRRIEERVRDLEKGLVCIRREPAMSTYVEAQSICKILSHLSVRIQDSDFPFRRRIVYWL